MADNAEIGGVDQPVIVPEFGDEWDPAFCRDCGWLDCECDDPFCNHEYTNRPESDTWFCMWCGEER